MIQLKWQKTELAEGYNVYQYVNGKWKKNSVKNGATNTSFRKKNTAKNTSYIYRIRAWRKFKGKTVLGKPSISISLSTKAPTVKGEFSKGSVYGPYLPEKELADVKRAVQIFKDSYLKSSMKDYDKIRTVFDYIRANCVYAGNTDKYPNTAWGCLVNGKAWCSGYARGAKALLDAAGIPCYYVHASKNSISPEHQWVQVKLGGKWYAMDCQGGFFLCGKSTMNACGLQWDSKGLPALSKNNHSKGGIFVEFEEFTIF